LAAHSREMLVPFPADMLTATPMTRPFLSGTQQGPDDRNLQVPDDLLNR